MSGVLSGKRVLITGASQGIGAQVADAFAAAGARLVLSARDETALAARRDDLASRHGGEAVVVAADLAEPDAAELLAERAWAAFDGLDVLVNNAGLSYPETVEQLTATALDATLAVNLRAPALLAARVGTRMADAGGGSIITMASAAGVRPLHEHYAYCLTKAGLIMATNVLALELGGRGVRANSLCPTVVLTAMGQQVWGDHPDKAAPMLAKIPLGRFAEPHEVSDAALWLASDASSMVTGVTLPVDGGLLLS
ncbi:NAD(P)-dependent dehydrogenase (short-subunit alcohol dehydrogenase family) [Friedmanniella endophytica]|uniref:NAD(P)-dependent dehydrogenase (Short-subunit alcohol dehydrogenase family) n=1 Tax=Microlunatus kandeliicorticis TaxID=1759536 RepID=A0A7W3P577_9ACTN|nr:glucose 1-dehydrogenase [Microlunatus kandeliicorticis]MBA8793572.1 NAD(P)-dependent dehydrogenase (short-subunit alcohol dehydrogenase family) [Microlunatus kandeliicorticis]